MSDLSKQAQQLDRKLAQRSLYYLCKEILGYKDMVPHVHGDFAAFLTEPRYGRFRQATMPRSFFKTWVGTVGGAIWLTLPDEEGLYKDIFPYKGPNARILIASNVIDNAAKMVNKIKQEWMNNDRLQAAFPELVPDFNKTRWSDHAAEIKRTIKATETSYTAVGAGGSVISQHFDHIIEDDLIYAKKDDFTGMELMPSQEDIDNAIGWHKLSFSLLANPATGGLWNIGTRWAPQDLIQYIRTAEKHYQCFEIDAEDDGAGDVAWPERYPVAVLDQIRAAQGARIYETQYRNRPRAMEDIVFKTSYVHRHASIDEFPEGLRYMTVVDLAGWGDSKGTARNVILTGAKDAKQNLWIARVDVGKYNPSDVINIFKSHTKQFGSKVFVEEVQYQRAVRHFARKEMETEGFTYVIEQLPFDGRKDAKNLRIRALEPVVTNGALHILAHMAPLLEELELYPHSKTVDILDCMGYLLKVGRPAGVAAPVANNDPFLIDNIERELLKKHNSSAGYPFDLQVSPRSALYHGRN